MLRDAGGLWLEKAREQIPLLELPEGTQSCRHLDVMASDLQNC